MFVRWKRRPRKRRVRYERGERVVTERTLLTAVLVRAVRRDGKPRQQVVAYLGSVIEENGVLQPWFRRIFWQGVARRVPALGLDPRLERVVVAALEERVPMTTRAEEEQMTRKLRELEDRIDAARGM